MTLTEAKQAGIAPWDNLIAETTWCMVYLDRYPCTPGHQLFVPKNNDNFLWTVRAMEDAVAAGHTMVANGECDGFNVGFNSGRVAGQTVMYPHVHLIPRRHGDVEDPTGGVRNIIPGKGNYLK